MTLAPPTVANLAAFTGRPSNAFNDYAIEALAQSTLLFYLATELDQYPDDINLSTLISTLTPPCTHISLFIFYNYKLALCKWR
jgi:hypothetical protein